MFLKNLMIAFNSYKSSMINISQFDITSENKEKYES